MSEQPSPDEVQAAERLLAWARGEGVKIVLVALPDQEPRICLVPPPDYEAPLEIMDEIQRHHTALLHLLQRRERATLAPPSMRPPLPSDQDDEAESAESAELPRIDAGNLHLPSVSDESWAALLVANDPPRLLRLGNAPVRLEHDSLGRPAPIPLDQSRLRYECARAAHWYRSTRDGDRPALPPPHVIMDMLATPTIPLPKLSRIVAVPMFTAACRLVSTPGYDAASGIYYAPDPNLVIPPVPALPTAADLAGARDVLADLLWDFPFMNGEARAHAIALPLEIVARELIDGPLPGHVFEAATPGSGKTLLADILTRPLTGGEVGVIAECRSDDEWRKRLSTEFRTLPPVICIDNIARPLDSGVLAAALTATVWEDRLLGTNDLLRTPIRNAWAITANNPTMSREIRRRVVRTRLNARVECPWERTGFRHPNLQRWATEHRGEIIAALLTLVQSWIAQGKPEGTTTLGSYERWAAVIGGILANAGIEGFLQNQESFPDEGDLETEMWQPFVALWWERFQATEVSAADLFALAGAMEGFDFGRGDERAQRISFGKQLVQQRDRVYGPYAITLVRTVKRIKHWRLVAVTPTPSP